jgi:hypothetical protein
MTTDLTTMTDEDLAALIIAAQDELGRRATLAHIPEQIEQLAADWATAAGREPGDAWVQPTGYHDAYPLGSTVTHDGREWESLRAGNPDEPGVEPLSSWREIVPEGAPPPEWQRPQAHNPYMAGDRVSFEGQVWVSLIDNNAWSPTEYPAGWELEEGSS